MNTLLETLLIIPMEVGLVLGILGIIPAIRSVIGNPPASLKHNFLIVGSGLIGAVGMGAGMSHIILNSAL